MRIVMIGATGHVGTYLVPRLVALGHEVTAISRGKREPYIQHQAWSRVASLALDSEDPGKVVIYDYSSDIEGPELPWSAGQRRPTYVYRHELAFARGEID